MKTQIIIYATLVIAYIIYNIFFKVADERINTAINILIASIIFGFLAYMAFRVLKKLKKK